EGPGDLVPDAHPGLDAHTRARGHVVALDPAGRGHEAAARVLAVDPELEGVAAADGVLVEDALPGGDAQLAAHQVHSGDLRGHGMLDLEPGVDLEEREGAVDADQELAGAGADVAGLAHDRLRGASQLTVT